jgi:hypothetical protein
MLCALNVALFLLLCYMVYGLAQDRADFASERAETLSVLANDVFGELGRATTFGAFKSRLKEGGAETDAIEYNDIRKLWNQKKLTPDHIDSVL